MKWEMPPDIKIYEALGAVADGRVEADGNAAKVYSSSGNKYYDVAYDAAEGAIMANDNGSYWKGYLGYPAIAYLMSTGVLPYDESLGALMKGVAWKDINTKFKNDFDKTLAFILKDIPADARTALSAQVADVQRGIRRLDLNLLGKRKTPPAGY
ncbi:MAG TPA: hypothetical protein VF439_02360 [Candidatus Paceibacterota bacterium]